MNQRGPEEQFRAMQTPPRPSLPGTWLQTPAGKSPTPAPLLPASISRNGDLSYTLGLSEPASNGVARAHKDTTLQQQQPVANTSRSSKDVGPDQRAARAINEALESESKFPELDGYLSRT
jgi:hypothetical protein